VSSCFRSSQVSLAESLSAFSSCMLSLRQIRQRVGRCGRSLAYRLLRTLSVSSRFTLNAGAKSRRCGILALQRRRNASLPWCKRSLVMVSCHYILEELWSPKMTRADFWHSSKLFEQRLRYLAYDATNGNSLGPPDACLAKGGIGTSAHPQCIVRQPLVK
jgi:hypothetical protein